MIAHGDKIAVNSAQSFSLPGYIFQYYRRKDFIVRVLRDFGLLEQAGISHAYNVIISEILMLMLYTANKCMY